MKTISRASKQTLLKASMGLTMIFAISVSSGLMAAREVPDPHRILQTTPRTPDRKPDSEPAPAPKKSEPEQVLVAVIDTGIDSSHPDLKASIWVNVGETGLDEFGRDKATNGIDDDGNGFVDDVEGYDFASRQAQVQDEHGHGTHIAGILVKEAPGVRIMNLKYFRPGISGTEALKNSLAAMRYAIAMKADIINYSGGGTSPSAEEIAVLTEASRKGILVVAAAGNEASNSESQPFYPANYRLPNILSVTAINESVRGDEWVPTSNFGTRSVAVAAQGKDVKSTLPGGRYGRMTGTSQATAFVTAGAVRILEVDRAEKRKTSPEEIIERLVVGSKSSPVLNGKTKYGSKLETTRALAFKNDRGQDDDRKALRKALRDELTVRAKVSAFGL